MPMILMPMILSRHAFVRTCLLLCTLGVAACGDLNRQSLYHDLSTNLEAQGHLRTETRPADAPFTVANLAENFQRIAFSYEFAFRDGRMVQGPIPKPLKRWQGTVRYRLIGDGVSAKDHRDLDTLFARLAPLTGLRFVQTDRTDEHLLISIASRQGRRAVSRQLTKMHRGAYRLRYDTWRRTPSWTCGATMSVSKSDPNRLAHAHIFLGAEATGIIRTSCLHEEVVQSLGLTNDYAQARPSIFNDDGEFALMTEHDAILLRVLYDRRLRPGMSAEEALPIARRLFAELLPGIGETRLAKSP